jgi:hypothetical protein
MMQSGDMTHEGQDEQDGSSASSHQHHDMPTSEE